MHDDAPRFHRHHGVGVLLSCDAAVASRVTDRGGDAVAFGSRRLRRGQRVRLRLTCGGGGVGAVRVGVTTHDPGATPPADLPRYACPALSARDGYWARALHERDMRTGAIVTLWVDGTRLMCAVGGAAGREGTGGALVAGLPPDAPLWLLVDLYGTTRALRMLPPDAVPDEIRARGRDALNAYQVACQSGTAAVFRSRLMLVGQDGAGKTSLKKALTGQTHDTAEESTDGIDLSASYTVNLADHEWLLTGDQPVSSQVIDRRRPEDERAGAADQHRDWTLDGESENELHEMIASNIVQELLYRSRRQNGSASDDASASSSHPGPAGGGTRGRRAGPGRQRSAAQRDKRKPSESAVARWQHELTADQPAAVTEAVERMWRDCVQRGVTGAAGGATAVAGNGDDDAAADRPDVASLQLDVWDFAGHAAYYTTHQIFLTSRALYIIVFNLCDDLESSFYSDRDSSTENEMELANSELTNLGYIDYWLSAIHSQTAQNSERGGGGGGDGGGAERGGAENTVLSPPIFIVGTHLFNVHRDPLIRQQMVTAQFDLVRKFTERRPYSRHIIDTFYAVENNASDLFDGNQIDELTRHIEHVASRQQYMGERLPTRWLHFEQAITDLVLRGTDFTSLEQMREVARMSGISSSADFETTLQFYGDLGVIVYDGSHGDATLRNTVILRPQWLVNMFKRVICGRKQLVDQDWERDLWRRLEATGILEEPLIDEIWKDVPAQKCALLALMEKYDLICRRRNPQAATLKAPVRKSYFVPSRLNKRPLQSHLISSNPADVVYYLDFNGFLPDGLFQRLLTRAVRWSQDCGGHDPILAFRHARFFLDSKHNFVLQMAALHLARIKVTIIRVLDLSDTDSDSSLDNASSAPKPEACAKVRHFLEASLSDLRGLWVKRICFAALVECTCERRCERHDAPRCVDDACKHFLNLDECISNKVVYCELRRIKTSNYRKWFPALVSTARRDPILSDAIMRSIQTGEFQYPDLPDWLRSAAKLLTGGADGLDWLVLAKRLGYRKKKVDRLGSGVNPGLELLTDWIVTSGNTPLSVDMVVRCLEQMKCDDIVQVIREGQESDASSSAASAASRCTVFVSYQWDNQDEVTALRRRLEAAGFSCWMDIGQMGGGDRLYGRIDDGIRNAAVVLACLTPKYVLSQHCGRELALADLLRKPIVPVMLEPVVWPPRGGMALLFSQLVYINLKGVGGHGGTGVHADLEDKYREVVQRVSCYAAPPPAPANPPLATPAGPSSLSAESFSAPAALADSVATTESPSDIGDGSSVTAPPRVDVAATSSANTAAVAPTSDLAQPAQVHVVKCAVCALI